MRAAGQVSLWLGTAVSWPALEAYLMSGSTEDGDLIPSGFASDFRTGRYEEGMREASVEPATTDVARLLAGISYQDDVIARFTALLGDALAKPVDAFVLLYDHAYDGGVETSEADGVRLRYMGSVPYR